MTTDHASSEAADSTRPRPKWAEAIRWFVIDEVIGRDDFPMDGSEDDDHDRIESAVLDTMCAIYGHEIIDDQCGIPEHRYCAYCNRPAREVVSDAE